MRKLLLLTAFVMSFAGSASPRVFRLSLPLIGRFKGVHGWFYLAKQKGMFAAEGLDVTIDQVKVPPQQLVRSCRGRTMRALAI